MNVWEDQFEPGYDVDSSEHPHIFYALCSSPRSGSHFVGHLLRETDVLGVPLEYFHHLNLKRWSVMAAAADQETFECILSRRTGPNGCFGTKLHHSHLSAFVEVVRPSSLKAWHWILLTRGDLLGQAISMAIAGQTGAWISGQAPRQAAQFDRSLVETSLQRIVDMESGWRWFFATHDIPYLHLVYEDVMADTASSIRRVADHVGVDLLSSRPVVGPLDRQRTEVNEQWREQFLSRSAPVVRPGSMAQSGDHRLRAWLAANLRRKRRQE